MEKRSKRVLTAIMLLGLGGLTSLQAQEAVSTAGGEADGSGGTVSYTVGQVVYTTEQGTNGNSIAQGVQQAFEISVVIGIPEAKGISLNVSAYPNPTTDFITVKVENYETTNLEYRVFCTNGKLLQTVKATGDKTQIQTSNLAPANYFVKVLDNSKVIKTFKVIKQ